ncbi:MAG: cupin domain-containing protein [Rectinema sp.]
MDGSFFFDADIASIDLAKGVTSRKIKAHGGSMMLVEMRFETGGEGAPHGHPHEQITYCLEGAFDFTLDGVTKRLNPGDSVYISANGPEHGVKCVARGRLLDVFTPQRDDFPR